MTVNEATRPSNADVFFDWKGPAATPTAPSLGQTVAVAATSDWGVLNIPQEITDASQISKYFGISDTPLTRAIADAFKGFGWDGLGGAGKVVAIRQGVASGGSAATKAVRTLQNTTPAVALTLTAKNFGTKINAIKTTVQTSTAGGKELLVIDGAYPSEVYQMPGTDITAVAAEITAKSKWWNATANITGVALGSVSGLAPSTAGTDGATLTGAEWTTTFTQLDRYTWNIFAPYGLTDGTIRASIEAWIDTRNAAGQRSFAYVGGATDEVLATANGRSQGLNNYNMVNLGVGSIVRLDEGGRTVSTAEMVARVAGARAFLGERGGDLFMRFADCEITATNGVSESDVGLAVAAGTTVFCRDTNDVPVYIQESVTTYTDDSSSPTDDDGNKTQPASRYSDIKQVAIQHGIEVEVAALAKSGKILGALGNTEKSQQMILGLVRDCYIRREAAQVVKPGWTVAVDGEPNYDVNYVQYVHGYDATETLRQMFNVARAG